MNDRHSILDSITGAFVPIHRDGYKFVAGFAVATLFLFLLAPPLGWLAAVLTAACAYFFRDPDRVTPDRDGLVVSAADGKIAAVAEGVMPPRELALGTDPLTRVSVFLSVLDVHIIRAPVGGKIIHGAMCPVRFSTRSWTRRARRTSASLRHRDCGRDKIGVILIAGLVARRIVTFVSEGASVAAGERIGLIRFGSRVDLYLPEGVEILTELGQTAIGGETVLAALVGEARRGQSAAGEA
ncbi:phosphatidylserine decarboxylase [Methyloceanibacter superfactus]|uniref:phosphatidylserine decarboxylase n=1 Tax=Methyloceanibacter superfactus TaxID=1774969 RepID=UPI000B103C63|nr:phosphatidylserine decarboxylase [Methyloceanibacter superfactus]